MNESLTTGDIGRMLGVTRQRVHQLIAAYPNFPKPTGKTGGHNVWDASEIMAWNAVRTARSRA